jgi:hypothetical protein
MLAGKDTMQPYHVSLRDLKFSRIYCVLNAYIDESYDSHTMAVGGWLAHEDTWPEIETKWLQRVAHENRMSKKRGFKPISRYHATDCGNLKREFSTENGWDVPRQIHFTKKLIDVLGAVHPRPVGIAVGLSIRKLKTERPDLEALDIKKQAYFLCMCECLANIGEAMDGMFPTEKVSVVHERSNDFDHAALSAFNDMFASVRFPYVHYFTTIAPGGWEDFPALQPADLIAYEGFKLTASRKRGQNDLRKSLQAVIGHNIVIRAGFFKDAGLNTISEFRP